MKYKVGDIIKTKDRFEDSYGQLDIDQFISIEYYSSKIGIILKVNKTERVYTVLFAGIEKKAYIKEEVISEKL